MLGDFFDGEVAECWIGPNLVEAYFDGRKGARRATLVRRTRYPGGRKARAAARRLWASEALERKLFEHIRHRYGIETVTKIARTRT